MTDTQERIETLEADARIKGGNLELALARVAELEAALGDMLCGWRYIRQSHGDLYGVGWDRAQGKAEAAFGIDAGAPVPERCFAAMKGTP